MVYFQFAGSRPSADKLSKRLADHGYNVPGSEQLELAANKREVRYFYVGDRSRAIMLARDVEKATGSEPNSLQVRDYTNWPGGNNRPPPGTLELWLDMTSS